MSNTNKKQGRLIIVLGMHRSGTSAVTRGLQVVGASLGGNLYPAMAGVNEKGFWEDIELNSLDNEILKTIDSDWFHLAPINDFDLQNLRRKGYILKAAELLRRKVEATEIFAFKDPRAAKLLPFWNEVIDHLQLDANYLIVLRNPLSVVKSLEKRDGFAPEHGYLLWLGHVLESLYSSAERTRIVVNYDQLMHSPDREVARIADAFNLQINAKELTEYKNDFLDAQLRHTIYSPSDLLLDAACPPIVREVHSRLLAVASDEITINDPTILAEIARWTTEFERQKSVLGLADMQHSKIASLSQAVGERDGQIASLSQAVHERDSRIGDLTQTVVERDSLMAQICNSYSWRLTHPLRVSRLLMKRVKSGIKQPIRTIWRMLPLSIGQKFRLKAAVLRYFPIAERLVVERSPVANASLPTLPASDASNHYENEYRERFNVAVNRHGKDFVPLSAESVDAGRLTVKVIAFYLPQFHPVPENDENWGLGFTEWTNVSKATPQFSGHYQPRLPGELGFYDLRLKEVQHRQIELARRYGIHGFCYHHYWFGGKKILQKPFQQVLSDPSLDLPFCLCWANENWTRRWDGGDQEIILAQNHSPEDDLAFLADILPALQDSRYIRIDGKPLLIVYRPGLLPDPAATALRWRKAAAEAGLPGLFIASAATFGFEDYESIGYDGLVQFPPHNVAASDITSRQTLLNPNFSGHVYDYNEYAENATKVIADKKHTFPCVMMNWDNEARKPGKGHIFLGASPESYKSWLRRCFDFVLSNNKQSERLVFINAWNEWAEGTYLEPDRRYGYAYLHATADLLRQYYNSEDLDESIKINNQRFVKKNENALVAHLYYFDLLPELLSLIERNVNLDAFITIPVHFSREQVGEILASLDNVYVLRVQNRGRDILPFLNIYPIIKSYSYANLVKVHSKKSPQRADGALLRKRALLELLDPSIVPGVLRALNTDPKIGLIAPSNSLCSLSNSDYLINNRKQLNYCLSRLGLVDSSLNFEFIAGSMFWARVDALRMLSDLSLREEDFEEELGQLDGTLAHAIERLFCFLGKHVGYRTLPVDQIGISVA